MRDGEVVIAAITRAHGVRGMLKVKPTGATLATLRDGDAVTLVQGERRRDAVVESVDVRANEAFLRLRGVASRDDAELLRGALVVTGDDRLPGLDEAEFYVRDLIGCRVFVADRHLGDVRQVLPGAANDVLEVHPPGGGDPVLVPFTRDAMVAVDPAAGRVDVRDGLLELPEP